MPGPVQATAIAKRDEGEGNVRRTLGRAICAALLGGTMLAVAAPAANATDNWDRPSQDFGSRSVGTTSDPQTFALVATCDAPTGGPGSLCAFPPGTGVHSYGAITATGPGFAIVPSTDICNARGGVLITSTWPSTDVCTLQVTFKPTSGGTKTGSLSTTTGPSGPLTVTLKGVGVGNGTGTTTAKKCKKKKKSRSAVAAKKCKKKK